MEMTVPFAWTPSMSPESGRWRTSCLSRGSARGGEKCLALQVAQG